MASKERSPNFPAVSLSKCLEHVAKLHGEAKRTPVKTLMALQAMGFNSINGRSKTILGALRAYGLVKVVGDTVQIADLALRIIFPKNEVDCLAAKHEAAMNPKLFRQIQDARGDLSEKILSSELFHEGFTQEGAAKAAQVFHQNRAFTGEKPESILESDDEEDDNENRGSNSPTLPIITQNAPVQRNNTPPPANNPFQHQRPMNAEAMLPIPLDIGDAFIPRGMSDDDFDLLLDSLKLWKRKIVRASPASVPRNSHPSSVQGWDIEEIRKLFPHEDEDQLRYRQRTGTLAANAEDHAEGY